MTMNFFLNTITSFDFYYDAKFWLAFILIVALFRLLAFNEKVRTFEDLVKLDQCIKRRSIVREILSMLLIEDKKSAKKETNRINAILPK